MHVSKMDEVKLAWLTFGSKRIVAKICLLAQLNDSGKLFTAFPHIPEKALKQKEAVEAVLKRLQKINHPLRYQLRLGVDYLEIKVKHHFEYNYRPYVTIDLDNIDPNDEVPEGNYEKKYKSPVKDKNVANQFQWQIKGKGNRGESAPPE